MSQINNELIALLGQLDAGDGAPDGAFTTMDARRAWGFGQDKTLRLLTDLIEAGVVQTCDWMGQDIHGRGCRRRGYRVTV